MLAAGLGGAVRARLPEAHPLRAPLRGQALDLALRHAQIRAELRALLGVWAEAGIPVLLFKGFALAEFEYASPGERFYGDVDVLLPEDPDTVTRAAHLALARGWRSDGQHADPQSWTHETMHLYSPGGHVRLDVHRWAVAAATAAGVPRLRDLTAGLWARAKQVDWQGVALRRPHPLDAAVLNLVLARSWGGDSGGVKPADYLDLAVLRRNHDLSDDALRQHARRLGGAATWAAFGEVCDPCRGRLDLEMDRTAPLLAAALARDGLSVRRGRWQGRVATLRRVWPQLVPALLDVAAAWWAIRRGGDPRGHLRRWTPYRRPLHRSPLHGLNGERPVCRLPLGELNSRVTAVNWWTRLLYPRQRRLGVCVPRAYATYRNLRRAGHPAVFVSGAGRRGGAFVAHAWVEDDRGSIELYGEPFNRQRFAVVFSFPEVP